MDKKAKNSPPTITVSQLSCDHWKLHGGLDKKAKNRIKSRQRMIPKGLEPLDIIRNVSDLPGEQQIIRIAQPVSPLPDYKVCTPPATPASSFQMEPVSPLTSTAPLTSDPNNNELNISWNFQKQGAASKEMFEYVRCKIAEVMWTPHSQEGENLGHKDCHPRLSMPATKLSAPQTDAHSDVDSQA